MNYKNIIDNLHSFNLSLKDYIACLFIAIIIVCIQLLGIFDLFTIYSDNYYYKLAFEEIPNNNITEAYMFFVWRTSGSEPLSFLTFYLFSFFTDYKTFIFILDVFFYWVIAIFYRQQKIDFLSIFVFVSLNYYFLIMSIGVHRVKLSFLFFFLTLIVKSNHRKLITYLAPFFHFQIFTIYFSLLFGDIINKLKYCKISKSTLRLIVSMLIVIVILSFYTKIFTKAISRFDFHLLDGLTALGLSILFLLFAKIKKSEIIIYLIILSLIIAILGGFRMNMVLFLSLLIISAYKNRKFFQVYNIVSSVYFIFKIISLYQNHYLNNLIE